MTNIYRKSLGLTLALTLLAGLTAQAAPDYNADAPVYPVVYTDAQKNAQLAAGKSIVKQVNAALAAGARAFTVPPGVYRLPVEGDASSFTLSAARGFTLNLAHTEFILGNGGNLVGMDGARDVTIVGPAKIDTDVPACTQGRIVTYDPATGAATVQILPGYEVCASSKGTVDAFSPAGVYLENPSWAGFSDLIVRDTATRIVQVSLPKSGVIYQPGTLLALRVHGSPVLISSRSCNGFTLKDIDVYTESGIGWGGGAGDWLFKNVRGIRRPGTSRLMAAGGCQMSNAGGNVTFDGCEFGNTADDLIDYGGGGLFTCERQEAPRVVITWGGSLSPGDTLNFYTSSGFQPDASAKVIAAADLADPVMQAAAHHLVKDVLKARDTDDKPLRRVTLDRDIQVAAGDYGENAGANRPDHFTVRNCYFHDSGVRVMAQGFRHGLFESNRFERISGGLALTCDTWWFEGPTVQDITVRNNVFDRTTFRSGWGTGKAALIIGAGWAEGHTNPALPCASHVAVVTGNTFVDSSAGAILLSNTDHVTVRGNVIRRPFTETAPAGAIQLLGVADAAVSDNKVFGCPSLGLRADGSRRLSVTNNLFTDPLKNRAAAPEDVWAAVIGITNCTDTKITGNKIAGTDAARG